MKYIDEFVNNIKCFHESNHIEGLISIERCNNYAVMHIENEYIAPIAIFLRESRNYKFSQLIDIACVDYIERDIRFELNYILLSIYKGFRCIIKTQVSEGEYVKTLSNIFMSANWCEREVWDMYGVMFYGHEDLRRILTDYHFNAFPLRKDYPLSGYTEAYYDPSLERVSYRKARLQQAYRDFDMTSPWKGTWKGDLAKG